MNRSGSSQGATTGLLRRPPFLFLFGAGAVLLALALLSWHMLRLERIERESQAEREVRETIRPLLWQMDSAALGIVVVEAARPYFEYNAFYAAARPYRVPPDRVGADEPLIASRLLSEPSRFVKLYYQARPGDEIASPQAPRGAMRSLALAVNQSETGLVAAEQRLDELRALLRGTPADQASPQSAPAREERAEPQVMYPGDGARSAAQSEIADRDAKFTNDYLARQRVAELAQTTANIGQLRKKDDGGRNAPVADAGRVFPAAQSAEPPGQTLVVPLPTATSAAGKPDTTTSHAAGEETPQAPNKLPADLDTQFGASNPVLIDPALVEPAENVSVGPFAARWIPGRDGRNELVLTRTVTASGSTFEQGMWMDWDALRQFLLSFAPAAPSELSLVPALGPEAEADRSRRLGVIPVELVYEPLIATLEPRWTPLRTTLLLTWIGIAGAITSVALSLRAAQELAARRGQFVTAVTHELRTPLTTFCMYSQMLADGMISSDDVRREYLATLKSESIRLAQIVENVLAYARLGRPRGHPRTTGLDQLLHAAIPSLRRRAELAGLDLVVGINPPSAAGSRQPSLRAEPETVERILFNLVDNACKYAGADANPAERRIDLIIRPGEHDVAFIVRDFGGGIPDHEQGRVFRPFFRSDRHAHGSTPGLGLGLALAQGLARELGGRLDLDETVSPGAAFRLTLPLVHL